MSAENPWLLLTVLTIGCTPDEAKDSSSSPTPPADTDGGTDADTGDDADADADAGTTLEVGESLTVNLEENPTTGYAWTLQSPTDRSVLNWTSLYSDESCGLTGGGGTRTFNFTGVAPGLAAIELHYARDWEDEPPLEIYTHTVSVVESATGTDDPAECVKYDFCCETFCEPADATSHYGEPDPCDCEDGYTPDPRACVPVDETCQLVD